MIKELPEKLKSLRLQFGFSQKQVAKKLGVSPSIISGYETGERTPSTENLLALSYLYNVSTDYLLGRQAMEATSLLDVSSLTDRQKLALLNLIESMKS